MIELHRVNCEEFKEVPKIPLIVILDDVRSLNNIGSVFRTADAFVVESIYLCGITATPPHEEYIDSLSKGMKFNLRLVVIRDNYLQVVVNNQSAQSRFS